MTSLFALGALTASQACRQADDSDDVELSRINIEVFANVEEEALNEISGMEITPGPGFIVHNDDGGPNLWLLDSKGEVVHRVSINHANNRDWEDLSRIEFEGKSLLAVGDIGDNPGQRSSIHVYFIETPGVDSPPSVDAIHTLELSYPDGPRDCEAMAFDSSGDRLLFLTKRDKPPRLYGVEITRALKETHLELEFFGTVPTFRPPSRGDAQQFGKDSHWVSQPTGMDINAEGNLAAVITYRSLYFYLRSPHETWIQAFQKMPREFLGPRSKHEEAIAFGPDMDEVYISGEKTPAPIFRAELPPPRTSGN